MGPWCGSSPDVGDSKCGAGNLLPGRAVRPVCQRAYSLIELVEYGFLKVALPSHSDRIADFTEGPRRAHER